MSPPPASYTTAAAGPAAQSMQLLGSPQNVGGGQTPQMMKYLMGLSGQGGLTPKMGANLGPIQQGPLGTRPPQPNQGGF